MKWVYKHIKDGKYVKFDYYLQNTHEDAHTDDLNDAFIFNGMYHGSNNHEAFPYLEEKRKIRKIKLEKLKW